MLVKGRSKMSHSFSLLSAFCNFLFLPTISLIASVEKTSTTTSSANGFHSKSRRSSSAPQICISSCRLCVHLHRMSQAQNVPHQPVLLSLNVSLRTNHLPRTRHLSVSPPILLLQRGVGPPILPVLPVKCLPDSAPVSLSNTALT